MCSEILIHEQAGVDAPAAAPVLVTCILANEERMQLVEESHVFLPAGQRYIQSIRYRKLTDATRLQSVEAGVQATRTLFLRHMACFGASATNANVLCDFERLEEAPFHGFKLAGQFLHEMAEIQEWTVSGELRRLLAEVLSYKSDRDESELLARIFNDYSASRRAAQAEARGYALNPLVALRWQDRPGPQNGR
jgi:hypothetical protein